MDIPFVLMKTIYILSFLLISREIIDSTMSFFSVKKKHCGCIHTHDSLSFRQKSGGHGG